jgi:hypothetical protein
VSKVKGLYKPGDVITVRSDLKPNTRIPIKSLSTLSDFGISLETTKFIGKKVTINRLHSSYADFFYLLEDNGVIIWHQDMFEESFPQLSEQEAFEMVLNGTLSPESYHTRTQKKT